MVSLEPPENDTDTPIYVWNILSFVAILSFWCQATVTEERFVPALNVIANYFKIPDDVAGATLMAAGASSPELFSSIVALFVTHSALGLGTIVGSEIFNQLIICAGAILSARDGTLKLDKRIVGREVVFYAVSIILLLYALSDRRQIATSETKYIFISFQQAFALFGCYIAYVFVCSYFDPILDFFSLQDATTSPVKQNLNNNDLKDYGSTSLKKYHSKKRHISFDEEIPFIQQSERKFELYDPKSQQDLSTRLSTTIGLYTDVPKNSDTSEKSIPARSFSKFSDRLKTLASSVSDFSERMTTRLFGFDVTCEKPSDQHQIHDVEINILDSHFSCFLWQRSVFYNKSKFALKCWHLRWFTFIEKSAITSVPDRRNPEKYKMIHSRFDDIEVDYDRLILKLCCPSTRRNEYFLMAPSREILDMVVKKCEENLQFWSTMANSDTSIVTTQNSLDPEFFSEPALIDYPENRSILSIIVFYITYPLALLMHLTIPDVRKFSESGDPTTSLFRAYTAIIMCLIWLIIGSYAMVASLESLAEKLNIPDAIIGVTVSAAGTSLPNYVASAVAARHGFGNMAVSNAFGSNTFNLTVGLGLPWTLYIALGNKFEAYSGLRDDGISVSTIILAAVLMVFVMLVLLTDFVLYRWHAYLFILMYAVYIAQAVAVVFISNLNMAST